MEKAMRKIKSLLQPFLMVLVLVFCINTDKGVTDSVPQDARREVSSQVPKAESQVPKAESEQLTETLKTVILAALILGFAQYALRQMKD